MVWSICLRLLADEVLAQDACQESYLRVWRYLPGFQGRSKLTTWIWAIVVRCCRDQQQREYRSERPRPSGDGTLPDSPLQGREEQTDREDLVARLLAELPLRDRELVLLFYMENHTVAEISHITGRGEGAIKTALHRVRKRMADHLHKMKETA